MTCETKDDDCEEELEATNSERKDFKETHGCKVGG